MTEPENFDHEIAFADDADAARAAVKRSEVRSRALESPHFREALRARLELAMKVEEATVDVHLAHLDLRAFVRDDGELDRVAIDKYAAAIDRMRGSSRRR